MRERAAHLPQVGGFTIALTHARRPPVLVIVIACVLAVLPAVTIVPESAAAATYGPPARLKVFEQPDGFFPHADDTFDIVVGIVDANGVLVTGGTRATITLSVATPGAPGAVFTCPGGLSRPTETTGTGAGTTTFADCALPTSVELTQFGQWFYSAKLTATASNVVSTATPAPTIAPGSGSLIVVPTLRSIKVTTSFLGDSFTWGETLTLRIRFTRSGANQPFRIEQKTELAGWTKLADLTTDATGSASFSHRPSVNTSYRVDFGGNAGLPAGRSGEGGHQPFVIVRQYAKQVPTQSTPRVIRRGTTVSFTTTVRPILQLLEPARVQLLVYHRVNGVWKFASVRDAQVDSRGVARFTLRFGTRGEWYVRSKAPGRWIRDSSSFPPVVSSSALTSIAGYSVR